LALFLTFVRQGKFTYIIVIKGVKSFWTIGELGLFVKIGLICRIFSTDVDGKLVKSVLK
jgi:hypothetical protein